MALKLIQVKYCLKVSLEHTQVKYCLKVALKLVKYSKNGIKTLTSEILFKSGIKIIQVKYYLKVVLKTK